MSTKRHRIKEHELQGFKYFKAISKILESLRDVGCDRDHAGNRILHMDQYISLLLLHMFNPISTSLRSLQQASELKKVQNKLGVPRASPGSLSEASTVFDSRPHVKRIHSGHGGPEQSETIAIATDLMEVQADVIALIFRHRWTIEIFFRFYRHILGCRHLLSYNQNGIELQTYAAIIACMLISLWTGRKPTLRTYEMLCWYFTGVADEQGLLSHIQRLKKND